MKKFTPSALSLFLVLTGWNVFGQKYDIRIYSRNIRVGEKNYKLNDTLKINIDFNEYQNVTLYKDDKVKIIAQYHLTRPSRYVRLNERMIVMQPNGKIKKNTLNNLKGVLLLGEWKNLAIPGQTQENNDCSFSADHIPSGRAMEEKVTIDFGRKVY